MNYKYEDLVVIPKNVLNNLLRYMPVAEEFRKYTKPLLSIVEGAFDAGNEWCQYNHAIFDFLYPPMDKEEFIKKEVEL